VNAVRKTTIKMRSDVRREQIVQAALKIVGKKGVSGLTTSAIARAVGISEANLYRHFRNKDEILFETGKGIGAAIRKNLEIVLAAPIRPVLKLKRAFLLHLEFIEKNEGIPRLGFSEEMHINNKRLKKEFFKNIEMYASGLESLFLEGQRLGFIRRDVDRRALAAMLFGMVQVLVMRWSLSGYSFSLKTEGMKLWKNFEKCIVLERTASGRSL
jgi:TetR/AcrR family transcriptional regulator, fatty acid metabolism regulator protein